MESIFRKEYQISGIHLDCHGRVKPSVLLYFAQEAAGGHCTQLALDWDTLAKRNLFWAVIRHRMQILRHPVAGETITVETWPMPTTRSAFPRATVGYDAEGKEVFRAISLWVLMDRTSRAMVLPGKSGIELEGTLRGCELTPPGSIAPKTAEHSVMRTVGYTELDRNGHMNNTRYMDWVDDLLPSEFHRQHPVRELTLCYLCEATEGQQIRLDWQLSEDGTLEVNGHRPRTDAPEQTQRIFAAKVSF